MKTPKAFSSRWRVLASLLGGLLALGGLGSIYQSTSAHRDLLAHPPPGALFDVGGYRLHLYCLGHGSPTVILLHGLGGNVYHWALIQPALAPTTRTCAYDRAGYAWSEVGPAPARPVKMRKSLLRFWRRRAFRAR